MFLAIATLSFDVLVTCIIKLLLDQNNKLENIKKGELGGILEIKNDKDIKQLSLDKGTIIKIYKPITDPIMCSKIYYEPKYSGNIYIYGEPSYNYYAPLYKRIRYFAPFATLWFKIYKAHIGNYLIVPAYECKLICPKNYFNCFTLKQDHICDGLTLLRDVILTYGIKNERADQICKNINLNGIYLKKDYTFQDMYIYLNIKKDEYDKNKITYNMIGPDPEMIINKKYKERENYIFGTIFFLGLSALTATAFVVSKVFHK